MTYTRVLAAGQRCQIWIGGPQMAAPEMIYETDTVLLEAPNWTLDGKNLVVNGDGGLWTLSLTSPMAGPTRINYDQLLDLNNDHVLDPDGEHVYLSAMDTHIYRAPLFGGAAQRVTPQDGFRHFLHGVSPDGQRLVYVQIVDVNQPGQLAVLAADGSVSIVDVGEGHLDGPEWSPDGMWIYFNTETFTNAPGHAQLARIPDGGGTAERLLTSDKVDWFPHLSPDAKLASYISFPAGTLGHPADLDVDVRVVSTDDWTSPLQSYPRFGGQGTLNVNSWAPDSSQFAFVAYPMT